MVTLQRWKINKNFNDANSIKKKFINKTYLKK